MKSVASRTKKLVKKGALYCAPFLLFSAAVILASIWAFQHFIGGSTFFDTITKDPVTPSPDEIYTQEASTGEQSTSGTQQPSTPGQTQTGGSSIPYPDTFPTMEFGKQWATLNVEKWERKDIPVIFGSSESLLNKGACMDFQSSFCGKGGRTILSAHVNRHFYELEDVKKGDIITMDTVYGTYRYRVTDIFVFQYDDGSTLYSAHQGEKNILFLYTCTPRKNPFAFKERRLGVIAEMIEGKDWSVAEQ